MNYDNKLFAAKKSDNICRYASICENANTRQCPRVINGCLAMIIKSKAEVEKLR